MAYGPGHAEMDLSRKETQSKSTHLNVDWRSTESTLVANLPHGLFNRVDQLMCSDKEDLRTSRS